MKDHNNPEFKSLLKRLQEESWQLELLISGFAIFGLFSSTESIHEAMLNISPEDDFIAFNFYSFTGMSIYILIFNLLLHVVLRGLWIGALGLRYVSGDIDYEKLKYVPKFTNYLKKKTGSFDK